DAEILALVIDSLLGAGLTEFQVSLGHVDFFQCLCQEAGFDEEMEVRLKELISNKNNFGVEELLKEQQIPEDLKELFGSLPQMFGNAGILARAASMTKNEKALGAVNRLQEISGILKSYGFEKYVSFDLGMLSKYMYYTGIIFRGYTFGTGEAIVKGGRYDQLLGHFGKDAPSVGFVVVTDALLNALARQKISLPREPRPLLLLYEPEDRTAAIQKAQELRGQGVRLALMEKDRDEAACAAYALRGGFQSAVLLKKEGLAELQAEEGGDGQCGI
ncbi:MAG: ATP phosphoribosyltransferase regulatory subunit, partial [Candidatus Limivivens sp.]|nr:ATP phosphoribosyltransferase regulatory subunit [Candidatus Limivivens sp.]